jgi:uncharacterized cupin superfamily protein
MLLAAKAYVTAVAAEPSARTAPARPAAKRTTATSPGRVRRLAELTSQGRLPPGTFPLQASARMPRVRKFNVLTRELDRASTREGYRWRGADVGKALGSAGIGVRLYELGEGQADRPFHFHHAVEEWLIVIAGAPVLRTRDGGRNLREGDVVCFPAGPAGGREVIGPGTVLILSAESEADAIEYPELDKLELRPSGRVFRLADAVDLWDAT